jgi:pimeloyl-ACP methyl ester carboxylesterase
MVDFFRWLERYKTGVTEKVVQVGDHQIAYLEGGKGETVILLHGFGDQKDSWVKFARPLTKTYRVIIPDLPGFGESSKISSQRYDIETQLSRMAAFIEKVDAGKYHVAGNSLGGLLAGLLAVTSPDRVKSLALLDPYGIANREKSELVKEIEKGVNPMIVEKPEDYDRLLKFMFVHPPSLPGPVKKYLTAKMLENKDFNKKVFNELKGDTLLEERMAEIKVPTLVLWGDTDRVFPASSARVLEQGIAGSKVVILKDCGHLPMTEKPEESSTYYVQFLQTVH